MGLDNAMDISVSAIAAQRLHMEIIASNLANVNTTRTFLGGPYRRKVPIFAEKPLVFTEELKRAKAKISGGGVEVVGMAEDETPFQRVYNPGHPDADPQGFVYLPNVDLSKEMVDLIYTSKLYEANITVFNTAKKMAQDTMTLP